MAWLRCLPTPILYSEIGKGDVPAPSLLEFHLGILSSLSRHKRVLMFLPFAGTYALALVYIRRWANEGGGWQCAAEHLSYTAIGCLVVYLIIKVPLWWWARAERRYWDRLR